MTPALSLVTGTRNRPEAFHRMLHSIIQNTELPWELVVSDASDTPYADTFDRDGKHNIRVIREYPPIGHVKGYNNCFRECRAEWVLWLNDDAEVLPGYDIAAVHFMREHEDVGLGCMYYREPDKRGVFRVNQLFNMVFANFGIIPTLLGNKIGWFDEDLYMYGSDNSLTFRVLLAGYGVVTVPGAYILHHSVMDEMRIENEQRRRPDGAVLNAKYSQFKDEMQRTYRRTAHLVGPRILPTAP